MTVPTTPPEAPPPLPPVPREGLRRAGSRWRWLAVPVAVVALAIVLLGSLLGRFSAQNFATVEYVGLYWHFVDVVWILLFTIIYLI